VAFRHGSNADLYIGANSIKAFSDSLEFSVDADTAETSTFGNSWKTFLAGMLGGSLSVSGSYDPTTGTGPAAILWACIWGGTPWAMVHFPGGSVAGQRKNAFDGLVANYTESSTTSDRVTFSAEIMVTGTVTPGTV
jgi:hypothetical protein